MTKRKLHVDALKAIAAFFVVFTHCFSTLTDSYHGSLGVGFQVLSVLMSSADVPLFIFIAGYFCRPQPYGPFVRKKAERLLLPFLTFSLLKLVAEVFIQHESTLADALYTLFFIGEGYWFVYCLFFLYLLAPLFWKKENEPHYLRRIAAVIVPVFFFNVISTDLLGSIFPSGLAVGSLYLQKPFFQTERVLLYLPVFLLGFLMREYEPSVSAFLQQKKRLLVPLAFVLGGALTALVVCGVIAKGFAPKFCIAACIGYLLYLPLSAAQPHGIVFRLGARYSLQVMFFDSFFRTALFAVAARFTAPNAVLTLGIILLDYSLACIGSRILEMIPLLCRLFGLQYSKPLS